MIVKVAWAQPNSEGHQMYHVYQASEYLVEFLGWSGSSGGPSGPSQARLMIDGDAHEIYLSHGDTAYIMNDEGKTIDVVRTI
jgi:hypothetical protein